MKHLKKCKFIFILCLLHPFFLEAQEDFFAEDIAIDIKEQNQKIFDGKITGAFSFGVSVDFGWRRNGSIRLFGSIGFVQRLTDHILIGGQTEIDIFRGGLGSSLLNNEKSKYNIELRHSLSALIGWDTTYFSKKPGFVTVGQRNTSFWDPYKYSFSLGSTFVNGLNHTRNQQIGTVSGSAWGFMFNYYNDATPFSHIGLSDKFDRYWTGGGSISYYFSEEKGIRTFTDFTIRYDNYTGYQRNLYEIIGALGIDNLPYKDKKQQMFNQARYHFKIGLKNNLRINLGLYEPEQWDVQYLIHYYLSTSPYHARPMSKRYVFGIDYNRFNNL